MEFEITTMWALVNKTLLNTGSVGNSFCLIRNDKKDSNVKEIRQAHYVILEGKYGEKEYSASTVGIEFVKVPYNVEKELEDDSMFERSDIKGLWKTKEDIPFKACSAAAAVIKNRATNGRAEWKLSDGTTLDEFERR